VNRTSGPARIFVTVEAADPIYHLGAVCELRRHPELELVQEPHAHPGTVAFPEAGLLQAIEYGVEVILWRHEAAGEGWAADRQGSAGHEEIRQEIVELKDSTNGFQNNHTHFPWPADAKNRAHWVPGLLPLRAPSRP
jgi:hypothetical protein